MLESNLQRFSTNGISHTMPLHPNLSHQTIITWGIVLTGHVALGLWILNAHPVAIPPTQTITELQIIAFNVAPSPVATPNKPVPITLPLTKPSQPHTHMKTTPPVPTTPRTQPSVKLAQPRTETILHTTTPSPSNTSTTTIPTTPHTQTSTLTTQENTPTGSTNKEANTSANAPQISSQNTENTSPPRTISKADYLECPPKIYPPVSQSQGDEGTPIIEALINEEGKPENVHIYKKSGYRLLDKAAMDYVKQCRFKPSKENGKAIARIFHIPIQYALTKEEE